MGFVKRRLFAPDAPHQRIPVGGEFVSGFLAPWSMRIVYTFLVEGEDESLHPDFEQVYNSGWHKLYYVDYDAAKAASDQSGQQFAPQTIHRLQANTSEVLNIADPEAFGDTIGFDIPVATMRKSKKFAYYQLVFLPSVVHAMAELYSDGKAKLPPVSFDALLGEDTVFDDEFFAKYCGDPDIKNDWVNSVFGQQRATLWKALGEDDVRKYTVDGKKKTDAELLSATLEAITVPWDGVWAYVVRGYDPRPDAVTSSGDHVRMPIIMKVFWDKEEALAYAEQEGLLPDKEESEEQSTVPDLPASWKELSQEDWTTALAEALAAGKSRPVMMKELDVTASELSAWIKYTS